ncbi:hypothetical protein Bbelb_015000 [Branchiostoma belcheri]|nr:hypothetical protein Bbelb_015000 [Branchiostoma belcheri]
MTSPRGNSQKASESSGSEFAMFWSHDYQETGEREGRDLMSSVVVGIRKLVGNAKLWEEKPDHLGPVHLLCAVGPVSYPVYQVIFQDDLFVLLCLLPGLSAIVKGTSDFNYPETGLQQEEEPDFCRQGYVKEDGEV